MKLKRLAGALLMIAAGLLACWAARGDSANGSESDRSMPGLDDWLLSMYSGGLDGWGTPTDGIENARTAGSGTLNLPAGTDRELTLDPQLAEDYAGWPAVLAPDFDTGEIWAASFGDLGLPAGIDWDVVSHPAEFAKGGVWTASMEPSFEMARHWREAM